MLTPLLRIADTLSRTNDTSSLLSFGKSGKLKVGDLSNLDLSKKKIARLISSVKSFNNIRGFAQGGVSELKKISAGKDYYTFWRGAIEHDPSIISDNSLLGRWFTQDKNLAEMYSKASFGDNKLKSLFRVDIPKNAISHRRLLKWKPSFTRDNEYILPAEWAKEATWYGQRSTKFGKFA